MRTLMLLTLGVCLGWLPARHAWAQDHTGFVPVIVDVHVTGSDPNTLTATAIRAVQATLPGAALDVRALNEVPLPGGNHVWVSGAQEQIPCSGEPRTLEYFQGTMDATRTMVDRLEVGGTGMLERLIGVAPCLNAFVDPEVLARAKMLEGIASSYFLQDEARTRRAFRDALVVADLPWDSRYQPQLGQIWDSVGDAVRAWRKGPFLVPVDVRIDGATDVRIDGRPAGSVLPGQHLLQWQDANGTVQGRLFTVANEVLGSDMPEDLERMRLQSRLVVVNQLGWQSLLRVLDVQDEGTQILLKSTFGSLTSGEAAAIVVVAPPGATGYVWHRDAEPLFEPINLSEVRALQRSHDGAQEGTAPQGMKPLNPRRVLGAFTLMGGVRLFHTDSYINAYVGGELQPVSGLWLTLGAEVSATHWAPDNGPEGDVVLPSFDVGAHYSVNTPIIGQTRIRPYLGGALQLLVTDAHSVGVGPAFVGGVELQVPGTSPAWLRVEGLAGGLGANGKPAPCAGIRLGLSLHNP